MNTEPPRGWIERFTDWVFQSWSGGYLLGALVGFVGGVWL